MSNFKRYLNVYEFETVLPGSGETIKFRPITTGQIKKLLIYEGAEEAEIIEKALDEVMEGCIVTEGFDIRKMFLPDRFFLLLELRKITKGNLYQFQSMCPSCNSQSLQTVDLQKLPIKKLNIPKKPVLKAAKNKKGVIELKESETQIIEDWNVIKLNDNISIRVMPVTRGIQMEAAEIMKTSFAEASMMEKAVNVSTIIYALTIQEVITPDGVEKDVSLEDKIYLLDNITQTELENLTSWFDKHEFGIDFTFEVTCPQCKLKTTREVPIEDFFS